MARTYKRDSRGRFSSSGATARGGRLTGRNNAGKSQGRAGGNLDRMDIGRRSSVPKGAVGGSRGARVRSLADKRKVKMNKAETMYSARLGAATKAKKKYAAGQAKAAQASRSKAFSSKTKNKARDAYKAATSKAREARMLAGGRTSTRGVKNAGLRTTVKAAQAAARKVKAMEASRGRSRSKRKG